jgi:hypothetical protein
MTSGITRVSDGERRLAGYLRLCDYVIYFGLSSSAAGFVFQNLRVVGLTLAFVSVGAVLKLGGVIVAYLVMSSRTPNADIAPWIRRWTRTASVLMGLAALYALIAGPDLPTRLLAAVIALLSLQLFRRVGSLTPGDLSEGWGPSASRRVFLVQGFLGPELDALLAGIWLVGAIVARLSVPAAFNNPPHNITQYDLKARVQRVYYAEQHYYQTNRRYSSDVIEIRPLAMPFMDSLVPVTITVDALGYRAIARHPYDSSRCGLWGGSALTTVKLEGVGEGQVVCWTGENPR